MCRTMNFILLSTILTSILTVEAVAANDETTGRKLRMGRHYFDRDHNIICSYVSSHLYETMVVSKVTELLYVATQHAVRGDCSDTEVCQRICQSYDHYTTTDTQCQCQLDTTSRSSTTTVVSTYSANTTTTTPPPPPPPPPTSTPTDTTTPTKTEFCSNPYGNPCGPGSACTDTETGISCTPINLEGCPVGCGPNSTCRLQSTNQTYECICNAGFARPQPFLPCIAKKK